MHTLAKAIADQFAELFVVPGGSLYWLDLVGAIVIATCILSLLVQSAEIRDPWFARCARICLTGADLQQCINQARFSLLPDQCGPLCRARRTCGDLFGGGCALRTQGNGAPRLAYRRLRCQSGVPANLLATVLVFIASDFGFFISHYLQHKVPLLWEFHKVHHSAEVLQPITSFRAHPVDQFVRGSVTGVTTGLAMAVIGYCFDAQLTMVTVLGTNVMVVLFNAAGSHLRHSHIL